MKKGAARRSNGSPPICCPAQGRKAAPRARQQASLPHTQANLSKLPKALAALTTRQQWAVWKWTRTEKGDWQKPPYQGRTRGGTPARRTPPPGATIRTALAAVTSGQADGITFILAADDPLAAIDVDHCRDPKTGSIAIRGRKTSSTPRATPTLKSPPSGEGLRIWGHGERRRGIAVNRKFSLGADGEGPWRFSAGRTKL